MKNRLEEATSQFIATKNATQIVSSELSADNNLQMGIEKKSKREERIEITVRH